MAPVYCAPAAITSALSENSPTIRAGNRKHTVPSRAMSASSTSTLMRKNRLARGLSPWPRFWDRHTTMAALMPCEKQNRNCSVRRDML